MNLSDLPISKTAEKVFEKPATTSGKIINALLLAAFSPLLKYEVKKEAEIEAYKQKIFNEISKIPEEKLIDPPLNIAGPAIEASKFYIDTDDAKSMFAKLIASSMNTDLKNTAHPSFIEVIKQLSPLDAQNLKIFSNRNSLPIANYRFQDPNGIGVDFKINVFLSNPECNDLDLQSTSISNLARLGLVNINYLAPFIDDSLYDVFKQHPTYVRFNGLLSSDLFKKNVDVLAQFVNSNNMKKYNNIHISKGIVKLTPYGESFVKSCI